MAGLRAGELNRRVIVFRLDAEDDGLSDDRGNPVEVGKRWMSRMEASDGEVLRSASLGGVISARFHARFDTLARSIMPEWQLQCDGRWYEVTGTKEIGFREGIEITAKAIQR